MNDKDDLNPESWLNDHGDYLYRFALFRVRSPDVAEDLVQETFLSAIRAFSGFQSRSSLRTWLTQILKNKIFDHMRSVQRQPTPTADQQLEEIVDANFLSTGLWNRILPDWARNPDQLSHDKEFHLALQDCIDKLPERFRQAFILRVIDGQEAQDVCNDLAITPSNLWVVLHRARLGLRECLERNWFAD